MPFVQKYKSGGGTRDLKKESNEYVYETPKEPEVKQEQVDNTPKTSTIVETNKPITDDKLTINGVELSKKKLIPYLEKKSFSATGVNRLAWDKTLDALKKVSTYNTSDSLDVDYGNNVKFDLEELKDRGNRVLADILKEASSGEFDYKKEDIKPKTQLTLNKFLGTELGLGVDYNPTEHNSVFTSFEEGNMEPEYIKNKSGVYVPKYKGKNIVYSKNLSTINRANIISKYLDKLIEEANSSDEGTKFLNNTVDKTEWLNRLNEAKNSISNLNRTATIKNAVPKFYRIGVDINQLFNLTVPTTQQTATEKNVDTTEKTDTENNVDATQQQSTKDKTKLTSTPIVGTSPVAPVTSTTSNLDNTSITTVLGKPADSNPYSIVLQPKLHMKWNKEHNLHYDYDASDVSSFKRPPGLKNNVPVLDDYTTYIANSKQNPFITGSANWNNWDRWSRKRGQMFNFYADRFAYDFMGNLSNIKHINNAYKKEYDWWNAQHPRKGHQGMSIDKKPYSILNYFEETPINTSNSNTFNKFGQFAQYKSIIDAGKKLTSKDQQKFNMFGDLENNLFDKLIKTPLENTTINKSLFTQPTNTKSSTVLKQNIGDIKNTEKVEKGLGSYAITGLGDLVNAIKASSINKNVTDKYINSLQTQEVSPRLFESAKVFQDQSNLGNILAIENSLKPISSDLSSYYGAKKEFNKNVEDYLLKEQNQQAAGIRQDRNRVSAIEDARNKEYSDVQRANDASKIQMNNEIARIESEKGFKQGEISLDLLNKLSNLLAAKKEESSQADQALDYANYQANIDYLVNKQTIIDKMPDSEEKRKAYKDLRDERIALNTNYLQLQKGKYSKFFTSTPYGEKTNIFN